MPGVVTRQDASEEEHDALIQKLAQTQRSKQEEQTAMQHYGEHTIKPMKEIVCGSSLDMSAAGDRGLYSGKGKWTSSWLHQFAVLSVRPSKQQRGETVGQIEMSGIAVLTAVCSGLWWQAAVDPNTDRITDIQGYLFCTSVFWGFWPLFNALCTFPSERSVLMKERASGSYRLSAYFVAKTLSDVPLYTSMPGVYAVITWHCIGLHHGYNNPAEAVSNLVVFVLVLLLNVLAAQSMGLVISTVVMDFKKSLVIAEVGTIKMRM
jgi:hypothetical protein